MSAFGLVVEFEIKPEAMERFMELIHENARRSVSDEPGCRQFDVLRVREIAYGWPGGVPPADRS